MACAHGVRTKGVAVFSNLCVCTFLGSRGRQPPLHSDHSQGPILSTVQLPTSPALRQEAEIKGCSNSWAGMMHRGGAEGLEGTHPTWETF